MFQFLQSIRRLVILAATMAFSLASGGKAPAAPPGDCGGGTIYYQANPSTGYYFGAMNCDGSAKTVLPLGLLEGETRAGSQPSRLLHGGQRWFLQNPLVGTWHQLVATRADGQVSVTLVGDPLVNVGIYSYPTTLKARWSPEDVAVSYAAQKYNELGEEVESGLYVIDLDFDADGTPQAVPGSERRVALYGFHGHDWSPDGSKMVVGGGGLAIVDLNTIDPNTGLPSIQGITTEPTWHHNPVWSPTSATIAFQKNHGPSIAWGIATISPDGSNLKDILPPNANRGVEYLLPYWSPTGTHLVFQRRDYKGVHIIRSTSAGKNLTNLTADLPAGYKVPIGWR